MELEYSAKTLNPRNRLQLPVMADSSSILPNADKPVIVRVKRKAFQSPLDAFWLEINDRPLKRALHDLEKLSISNASSSTELEIQERPFQRPLLDLENLSLSDASSSRVEELSKRKILVRHVKTIASSEETFDVLRSFVPNSSVELKSEENNEGRRRSLKTVNRQDPLQVKARQRQEILSRNARFEQIWRSRKEMEEAPEDAIYDMCKLYDIVRVDAEEENVVEAQNDKDTDLDDCKMMADFLPLLKDVLPNAAEEIESDIQDFMVNRASPDGYVYDFYAVNENPNELEADPTSLFPLVQVDDNDEYFDGPDDAEYETDDSNAENHPMNDYPEEEMSEDEDDEDEDEDEDETTSRSSDEESEGESRTSGSNSEEENGSGGSDSYYFEEYDWLSGNEDGAGDESDGEAYL